MIINYKDSKSKTITPAIQTIYERRAVRKYLDKTVDKALIERILDAGRMAPSAMNRQPWKFYIVTNHAQIRAFSKAISAVILKETWKSGVRNTMKTMAGLLKFSHGVDWHVLKDPVFYGAPVVIFITAPKENEWSGLDIGMCTQNILLAAKSLGLDTCPVGIAKYVKHTKIYPLLQVPSSDEVLLAVIAGYGDELPEMQERIRSNALFIE